MLTPTQINPKSFESRQFFSFSFFLFCFFSFLPGADAPRVYVSAWTLCCFHSFTTTQTFQRAVTASVDSCAEMKSAPFSSVTRSGRVWRKVPESDARSVISTQTFRRALTASVDSCAEITSAPSMHSPSIAFRHLPPNSARFSYATEGALFISAQLSTDAVSAPPKGLGTNMTVEAAKRPITHVNTRRIHPG